MTFRITIFFWLAMLPRYRTFSVSGAGAEALAGGQELTLAWASVNPSLPQPSCSVGTQRDKPCSCGTYKYKSSQVNTSAWPHVDRTTCLDLANIAFCLHFVVKLYLWHVYIIIYLHENDMKICISPSSKSTIVCKIINRPGVAGAVLQTAS